MHYAHLTQLKSRARFAGALLTVIALAFALVLPASVSAKTKVVQAQTVKAPSITGLTAPTTLKVGQEGTWKVKASDSSGGSLSYSVDWGDQAITPTAKSLKFVQTSSFTHAYNTPGTYTATFTVENEAGLTSKTSATVRVTGTTTQTGPVISKLVATSTSKNKAEISWRTNVEADSRVWYSTTSPVDTTGNPQKYDDDTEKKHEIELKKLDPDTTYYVVVGSKGKNGVVTKSSEVSFKTMPKKNTPVITSIEGHAHVLEDTENTWTINAYDPKNTDLSYSVDWGDAALMMKSAKVKEDPFTQTSTFSHTYADPGTYTITFTVMNESGHSAVSTSVVTVDEATSTPPDVTPPVVSGQAVSINASSTATVTWTTDEPATSRVYYSLTSPVDILATSTLLVSSASLVTSHSLSIPNLATSTLYYFLIRSGDATGNNSVNIQLSSTTPSGI
ncbi:MAG: PKD domain-containing protein [Patescibacteria group bacterium]